jgi:hypothetical protein
MDRTPHNSEQKGVTNEFHKTQCLSGDSSNIHYCVDQYAALRGVAMAEPRGGQRTD